MCIIRYFLLHRASMIQFAICDHMLPDVRTLNALAHKRAGAYVHIARQVKPTAGIVREKRFRIAVRMRYEIR